ncbi:hypothetical protein [Amycolatopsis sp.]|uniref:hypothetical protein n=1 Tax=Amycolatopsis sp. TaxID=37632 RepID=UPI002CE0441A|nr:hypothetical protein [Amycolatopsis sp.]HVV13972.1 hypothetical protein [Amycolatopsis sp.]
MLLASHLINEPDSLPLLAAVRRHLSAGGRAIVECYSAGWFDTVADGSGGTLGEVEISLSEVARDRDLLSAVIGRSRGREWVRAFTARRLDQAGLVDLLAKAGLRFRGWCASTDTWFSADLP